MRMVGVQTVYPDTSYWVAMRCAGDSRHEAWATFHPDIELAMRSGDVVHVAVARLCGADLFVTCDADQHALAEAAGLDSALVGG